MTRSRNTWWRRGNGFRRRTGDHRGNQRGPSSGRPRYRILEVSCRGRGLYRAPRHHPQIVLPSPLGCRRRSTESGIPCGFRPGTLETPIASRCRVLFVRPHAAGRTGAGSHRDDAVQATTWAAGCSRRKRPRRSLQYNQTIRRGVICAALHSSSFMNLGFWKRQVSGSRPMPWFRRSRAGHAVPAMRSGSGCRPEAVSRSARSDGGRGGWSSRRRAQGSRAAGSG